MSIRFSIITAVRNGATHLEHTLRSVREQRGVSCEHLVIDGGSTDGTLEVLRKSGNDVAWWTSEPDRGIAHAMNKGIARARGEWLLFLNADDYLASPYVFADIDPLLHTRHDLVSCGIRYWDGARNSSRFSGGFGASLNFKTRFYHQGVLFNHAIFERLGGYDERFKIAMDYEFFLRAYRAGTVALYCPQIVLSVMRSGGLSDRRDRRNLGQRLDEERAVHEKHCRGSALRAIYRLYWALYRPYKLHGAPA